jgi:hypothetical protein
MEKKRKNTVNTVCPIRNKIIQNNIEALGITMQIRQQLLESGAAIEINNGILYFLNGYTPKTNDNGELTKPNTPKYDANYEPIKNEATSIPLPQTA